MSTLGFLKLSLFNRLFQDKILQVENKLEEMFAGIVEEEHIEPVALEPLKNDSTLGLTDDR